VSPSTSTSPSRRGISLLRRVKEVSGCSVSNWDTQGHAGPPGPAERAWANAEGTREPEGTSQLCYTHTPHSKQGGGGRESSCAASLRSDGRDRVLCVVFAGSQEVKAKEQPEAEGQDRQTDRRTDVIHL
jgi:hypothetical protein